MKNKIKLTIAVTGINNTDNPGPGIPLIRGLKQSDIIEARIIGLAYENLEPGIYMNELVDCSYIIPYPSVGKDAYMQRILEIHQQESFDVIIPNLDSELYNFIKSEKLLEAHNINIFLPSITQLEERNKSNLGEFGEKYNVLVPKGVSITSTMEIGKISEEFQYPLLVKGKFYDAYIAYNPEQVAMYFNKINAKWGLPVVIQEYVKGTEVNVVALGDGKGNTISAVPMRKQYITDKGKAWGGVTLKDDDLLELTYSVIQQTKWKGVMELEIIRTQDNKYYLIEINPRVPAWVYLAVGAGQNIPEALVLLMKGYDVKPMTDYEIGKMFIRYSYDLIGNLSDLEKISIEGKF